MRTQTLSSSPAVLELVDADAALDAASDLCESLEAIQGLRLTVASDGPHVFLPPPHEVRVSGGRTLRPEEYERWHAAFLEKTGTLPFRNVG